MNPPLPAPARRHLTLALAAALALGGCAAQPIAPYTQPSYSADVIQRDFSFRAGGGELAAGEAGRLDGFLRELVLRPQDAAQVYIGRTGSAELDAARVATIRGAFTGTPARLQVLASPAFDRASGWADTALVLVHRNGLLVVTCPNSALDTWERDFLTPVPDVGCANALNLAHMAATPRDLTSPRPLRGSDGVAAVMAVDRYRADKVKVNRKLNTTIGN